MWRPPGAISTTPRSSRSPSLRLAHVHRAQAVQPLRVHRGELLRHVLHDRDARAVAGSARQHRFDRLRAAGGAADHDRLVDRQRMQPGDDRRAPPRRRGARRAGAPTRGARPRARRGLQRLHQFAARLLEELLQPQARLGHHGHRAGGQRLQRHLAAVGGQRRADHGRDRASRPSSGAGRSGRPCPASRCPAAARRAGSCGSPGRRSAGWARCPSARSRGRPAAGACSVCRTTAESSTTYTLMAMSCFLRPARRSTCGRVGPDGPAQPAVGVPPRSCVQHAHAVAAASASSTQSRVASSPTCAAREQVREHVAAAVDIGLAQPRADAALRAAAAYIASQRHVAVGARRRAAPAGAGVACTMWHIAPTVRRGSVRTTATQEPEQRLEPVAALAAGHVARVQRVQRPAAGACARLGAQRHAGDLAECARRQRLQRRLAGHPALGGADEEQAAGPQLRQHAVDHLAPWSAGRSRSARCAGRSRRTGPMSSIGWHRLSWPKRTRSRSLRLHLHQAFGLAFAAQAVALQALGRHVAQPVLRVDRLRSRCAARGR